MQGNLILFGSIHNPNPNRLYNIWEQYCYIITYIFIYINKIQQDEQNRTLKDSIRLILQLKHREKGVKLQLTDFLESHFNDKEDAKDVVCKKCNKKLDFKHKVIYSFEKLVFDFVFFSNTI
jgi:hypothetical protein